MCQLPRNNKSIVANQSSTCSSNSFLPVGSQWDVGGAGVAAVEGPFGLAVSDDEATGRRHGESTAL